MGISRNLYSTLHDIKDAVFLHVKRIIVSFCEYVNHDSCVSPASPSSKAHLCLCVNRTFNAFVSHGISIPQVIASVSASS